MDAKAFHPVKLREGVLVDLSDDEFPTVVSGFNSSTVAIDRLHLNIDSGVEHTSYVMVADGEVVLNRDDARVLLSRGMFAVVPGPFDVYGDGEGLIITRLGYRGLFQLGGPIEQYGRLKYIDGCSDSLLVCPPVIGEPCLNHLHLPAGTNQTQHTHPSSRIGIIMRGQGRCITPNATYDLHGGMGWFIPTGCEHSFHTFDESLDVIAWHPDSDFGPQHDNHPMINRTYVDQVSARHIDAIRTVALPGETV